MDNLNQLKEYIDCDWFIKNEIPIRKYYKTNKKAYRKIHSKKGFMHMSISFDNKLHEDGELYQPNTVQEYITENTKNILELGCGQGANLLYLADKNPSIQFIGIDLKPSINKKLSNVQLLEGDYHSLDKIPDDSQDIVYAFETLCYSTRKNVIFQEVSRVLKAGGIFIIFDGYAKVKRDELSQEEKELMLLVEKGMAVQEFEYIGNIPQYFSSNGFVEVIIQDLSINVLPNMKRFKNIVTKAMKLGKFFKFLCKILPKAFVGNAISGYLMAETIEKNYFCYYEHIFRKK